ncbi:prephenate dehydrogenase dimerization domain-containing protein [Campylobacter pinnipediorum]|uniref:prephenate dehydrogenase dimerization domain-containing protein n=1 Tax=Campylobacter pinnipediorum TaxID=1965231 RepID=UPI003AB0C698
MIRVAKSSSKMWTDIFKQNKDNILDSIDMFKKELNQCEYMISNEKWDEVYKWMSDARTIREIL